MGNDLTLRRWRLEDCQLLHTWRLHPANRRWFCDSEEISQTVHEQWFARFMADPQKFGFILEDAGLAVAQIRFDPAELPGCYRISLSVAPDMSGRGYGSQALRMACGTAEMQQAATLFIAETMLDNFPSQKVFQRNGFVETCRASRNRHEVICWLAPSGRLSVVDRLPIRIFCTAPIQERLMRLLAVTGLADISEEARVCVFFDAMSSEAELAGSPVFHVNANAGRVILDLALNAPFALALPLEFDSYEMAVAQIAAAIRHALSLTR